MPKFQLSADDCRRKELNRLLIAKKCKHAIKLIEQIQRIDFDANRRKIDKMILKIDALISPSI